jgi:hypothetical protein
MRIPPPVLTREHGSWVVFAVPIIIGLGVAGRYTPDTIVLTVAALASFLASVPAQRLMRAHAGELRAERVWLFVYGAIALVAGSLLLVRGYVGVLIAAILAAVAFAGSTAMVEGRRKTAWSDLVATAGLSLGAPMAYYVASEGGAPGIGTLYLLTLLWFGWSMVHVHVKLRASAFRGTAINLGAHAALGRPMIVVLLGVWIVLTALARRHTIPVELLIAYVPATVHGVIGIMRLRSTTQYKNLGFILLGQSLLFAALVIYAARATVWPW